jgi:hypothetical protein
MTNPWEQDYSSDSKPWEESYDSLGGTQPDDSFDSGKMPWEESYDSSQGSILQEESYGKEDEPKKANAWDYISGLGKGALGSFADFGYSTLEGVGAAVGAITGDYDFARGVSSYRNFAQDFYTGDVSEDIKESFAYKASNALGAMPGYAAAAATPVGWSALLASGYQSGRDDYLRTMGTSTELASEEQLAEANKVGGMMAVPMMLLEKFGAGKLVGNIFREGGELTAKEVAKRVTSASLSEGATEGMQTSLQNFLASQMLSYDPDRKISQDVLESMALGAIASGGITGGINTTYSAIDKLQAGIAKGEVNPAEVADPLGKSLIDIAIEKDSIPEVGSSKPRIPSKFRKTKEEIDKIIRPISSQFKEISPSLQREVRNYERRVGMSTNEKVGKVESFVKGLKDVRKASKADYNRMSQALFNGAHSDTQGLQSLLSKYGMSDSFVDVQDTMASIRQEAVDAGVDVGEIENYFPRIVKDLDRLKSSMGAEVSSNAFDQLVYQEEKKRSAKKGVNYKLSKEEKQLLYEQFAKKSIGRGVGVMNPSNLSERSIDLLDESKLQYYHRPEISLPRYLENMVNKIETTKLIGAQTIDGQRTAGRLGQVLESEVEAGKIKGDDARRIQDLVGARFGSKPEQWGIIKGAKNAGYLATMGNFGSAVTQLGDFAFSAYQNGLLPTGKALFSPKEITLDDIGINPNSVTVEANEGGFLHKTVNNVFEATGLSKMDRLAKNTNINAAWGKLRSRAKAEMGSKRYEDLKKELQESYGEGYAKVISDLRTGKKSDEVFEVLYNQMADIAPISMSEMPPAYASNPNARIAYQLKSYTIKQFDFMRQEAFSKIASGDKKQTAEGLKNLVHFGSLAMAANASADVIKSFMFNDEIDPDDLVWDNMLTMFGMNKYAVDNVGRKGVGSTLLDIVKPAQVGIVDNIGRDLSNMTSLDEARSAKYIPIVGKLYDKWYGRGSE